MINQPFYMFFKTFLNRVEGVGWNIDPRGKIIIVIKL